MDLSEKRKALRHKVIGSIMGACINDALGLPCECSSPADIQKKFGYVDKYVSNHAHPFKNVAKQPPATISDDSQLTLAMMFALRRGYNLQAIASAHVDAFDGKWGEPVGWGKSTREACVKMKKGLKDTLTPDGAGNGTCMKIAPLAIYSVYRTTFNSQVGKFTNAFNKSLFRKCKEITELTHGHPMCIVAAYCQTRMVIRALQDELTDDIPSLFVKDALFAESNIETWPDDLRLSTRFNEILTQDNLKLETSVVSTMITTKESSFVYNSYPLVAYCFSKYAPYKNFRLATTSTINAGADADSNGSMVGALMGAHLGILSIPRDWIERLPVGKLVLKQTQIFEESLLKEKD